MPSKSKAQHNFMAMVANDPKAAKRVGVPQSVGREFMKHDKGKKYAEGGMPKVRRPIDAVNPDALEGRPPPEPGVSAPKRKLSMEEIKAKMDKAKGTAKKPEPKKYAMGGMPTTGPRADLSHTAMPSRRPVSPGAAGLANAAMRSGREMPMTGPRMAKGGKVRGDGIARKGHTKGRIC